MREGATVRDPPSILPGAVVGGRYEIHTAIARGGMGTVYAATETASGRSVAIKILHPDITPSGMTAARFRREANILDGVQHPGVVGIRDCGELDDGSVFVVMELLNGETLRHRMRREAPMPPEALVPIVQGLCDALAEIHARGLVHRDLKPSNVFLTADDKVKLIDFGVARAVELERLTQTGQIVGTPRYMAPEQLRGTRELDGRTDLYALGVVLYGALSGRPAFVGEGLAVSAPVLAGRVEPIRSVNPAVPAPVADVVARAMAVDRDARFANARELADAFTHAARGRPMPTPAATEAIPSAVYGPTIRPEDDALRAPIRAPAADIPRTSEVPALRTATAPTEAAVPSSATAPARPRRSLGQGVALVLAGVAVGVVATLSVQALLPASAPPVDEPPAAAIPASSPTPAPPDIPPAPPPVAAMPAAMLHPVLLTSEPSGALVLRDQTALGSTPIAIPLPADERAGWELLLRLPEHDDARVRVTPVSPDRIHVELDPARRSRLPRAATTATSTTTAMAAAPTVEPEASTDEAEGSGTRMHTMVLDPWR